MDERTAPNIAHEQKCKPNLGCATTRELLLEIKARGECEDMYIEEGSMLSIGATNILGQLPGSMLDYKTVGEE